jgi:mono/diheme cytochrome c family protein
MIRALMRPPVSVPILAAVALAAAACGTQKISVPKGTPGSAQAALYHGAYIFSERCAGCHTLSYAGTHGSAVNVRTAQANNGPNFNIRCERPAARVLYAIENGGFSGAIMPQNVVVGQEAIDVAKFVATYSGRQAPLIPGVPLCDSHSIYPVTPPPAPVTATTTTPTATPRISKRAKTAARTAKGTQGKAHVTAP